jgi:hypothetical protein
MLDCFDDLLSSRCLSAFWTYSFLFISILSSFTVLLRFIIALSEATLIYTRVLRLWSRTLFINYIAYDNLRWYPEA